MPTTSKQLHKQGLTSLSDERMWDRLVYKQTPDKSSPLLGLISAEDAELIENESDPNIAKLAIVEHVKNLREEIIEFNWDWWSKIHGSTNIYSKPIINDEKISDPIRLFVLKQVLKI